ncbi:MAG TPA: SGNH/GDSL hydrolase family protein [Phycisphaerae bacterium]|nr:SGNH/GDSL hydrolase family protein [Phycisphaerae bacterium]
MRTWKTAAAAAALLCTLSVWGCAAPPLLKTDFEQDPRGIGWEFRGAKTDPRLPLWEAGDQSPANHYLAVPVSGHFEGWHSPLLPVVPGEYYQVEFRSQSAGRGYCGAIFYDAEGKELIPDHYSGSDPSSDWTQNTFCFRAKTNAARARLRFRGVNGKVLYVDDVVVRGIRRRDAAKWADTVYSQLPPLRYTPPAERWAHIPRTMRRLREGGSLRVVLLGDSIVNDTGNSAWETLLERVYRKAKIEVVTSVRGGTGCDYYRRDGRVKQYVLDYDPDLVIIGGVCNRRAEPVRDVIRQIRAASKAEVLILSGAFGRNYRPPADPDWTPRIDPDGKDYRSQLFKTALEEKVELLDMRGATDEYFRNCGKPIRGFMRDDTHPNERGRQIIGRVLVRYLSPDVPMTAPPRPA